MTSQQLLAAELREVAASLREALDDIIDYAGQDDRCLEADAFESALRRVRAARIILESEAGKLEAAVASGGAS